MAESVTVVCLVYNQVSYVAETLRSICDQDYPALEVIATDDGSTDGTQELLSRLERELHPRLRVILNEENAGIAANTNRGLRAARGDLIGFCGGDDLFLPGKVQAQVDWLGQHPECVLNAHDVEYFDTRTGRVTGRHSDLVKYVDGRGAEKLLARGNILHAISVMVRRSALPAYGVDERVPIANDYKLWIDCLARGGGYGFLRAVYARYRIGVGNVTRLSDDRIWKEAFLTLGLVEGEHPELTDACRQGRARMLGVRSLQLMAHSPTAARAWIYRALGHSVHGMRMWPAWLAVSAIPTPLRQALLRRLRQGSPTPADLDPDSGRPVSRR